MAYDAAGLHRIGGASGAALWMYRTADAIATVNTAGYFNTAAAMLNIRDLIIVQIKERGLRPPYYFHGSGKHFIRFVRLTFVVAL